jgi:DNA/RNA-binding domain of Phe-tRNA-synthetase-like protein
MAPGPAINSTGTTLLQPPDATLVVGGITGRTIRPLLGVNVGPIPAGNDPNNANLTNAYRHIGVTLIRTHDFYGPLDMAKMYPSINIGIAVIKGVNIKKTDPELKKVLGEFIATQSELSNETISSYKEVQVYRKLYKEMGLDWHSKRPSPEALLRRIAQKKELYEINNCVDAYNLIVMKNRVSIGAFDLDKLKTPTVLRFPKQGEEILLLGDKEPTKYRETDLAYFDDDGGYNIYFNYRDAQRTAVSEDTKNIILNIDGIYDISRSQVEQSLKESVDMITKYCGGKVEVMGIVSAS